ncbi:hypothetical protein QTP70_031905, partial [Hemibagrus guttatus]
PLRRVTFSVATDAGCYDSGVDESETPSSKSSKIGVLSLPEDGYERTTPEGSVGEEEHVENDSRQLPDVALTGKCTRDCGEYGHSDTCWMPVHSSPRRHQGNGAPRQRMSSFTSAGDDNNNHDNSDREEEEGEEDDGSDQGSGGGGANNTRSPLANGDPLASRRHGDRNRNIGDHNRNLLNRKMTSASYDTFSSARFGGQCHGDDSEVPCPHEVIPLTRAGGGDFKTTSCLTLSRREVYL